MNILFYGLNLNPPWVEGLRNTVRELARTLKSKNNMVYILTKGAIDEPREEEIDGIRFLRIPVAKSHAYNESSLKFIIKSANEIRHIVKKYDIDIVHGHSSYPLIGTVEKFAGSLSLFTLYSKLGSRSRVLEYNSITNYLLSVAKSKLLSLFLKGAVDHIICISPSIYETLPTTIRSMASIIPLGVNTARFNPSRKGDDLRNELGVEDEKLIFMIGDVTPWKGSEVFIEAAKRVVSIREDVKFVIFTKGTYEFERERLTKLKKIIKAYDLTERFYFIGVREKIENVYAAADVAVFPYLETFALMSIPLSLLELMALGKPIIATRVGDINYAIRHGVDGILVEPGSVKEIARNIIFLLDHEDTARMLGSNAWKRAKSSFSWKKVSDSYISLYRKLAN